MAAESELKKYADSLLETMVELQPLHDASEEVGTQLGVLSQQIAYVAPLAAALSAAEAALPKSDEVCNQVESLSIEVAALQPTLQAAQTFQRLSSHGQAVSKLGGRMDAVEQALNLLPPDLPDLIKPLMSTLDDLTETLQDLRQTGVTNSELTTAIQSLVSGKVPTDHHISLRRTVDSLTTLEGSLSQARDHLRNATQSVAPLQQLPSSSEALADAWRPFANLRERLDRLQETSKLLGARITQPKPVKAVLALVAGVMAGIAVLFTLTLTMNQTSKNLEQNLVQTRATLMAIQERLSDLKQQESDASKVAEIDALLDAINTAQDAKIPDLSALLLRLRPWMTSTRKSAENALQHYVGYATQTYNTFTLKNIPNLNEMTNRELAEKIHSALFQVSDLKPDAEPSELESQRGDLELTYIRASTNAILSDHLTSLDELEENIWMAGRVDSLAVTYMGMPLQLIGFVVVFAGLGAFVSIYFRIKDLDVVEGDGSLLFLVTTCQVFVAAIFAVLTVGAVKNGYISIGELGKDKMGTENSFGLLLLAFLSGWFERVVKGTFEKLVGAQATEASSINSKLP